MMSDIYVHILNLPETMFFCEHCKNTGNFPNPPMWKSSSNGQFPQFADEISPNQEIRRNSGTLRSWSYICFFFVFFNYYLAAPRPTSGHYRGDSLTHPMLITAFVHVRPEGHREPRSEVGSLSPAERLAGFEPGTFRFL